MIYAPRSMYRPETSLQKKVNFYGSIILSGDAARRGNVHHESPRDCKSRGSRKCCGDVRDKTFFTHVMPENCAVVSKSAVFTHARSLAAW